MTRRKQFRLRLREVDWKRQDRLWEHGTYAPRRAYGGRKHYQAGFELVLLAFLLVALLATRGAMQYK